MFKLTPLLLLCTTAISAHAPDLFRGCVPTSGNHRTTPHTCIVVPTSELSTHGAYYTMLAEAVLKKPSNQLHPKFLNTVYNVTRAAVKYPGHMEVGATLRMEFLTARSDCLRPCPYSVYACPPVDKKRGNTHGPEMTPFCAFSCPCVFPRYEEAVHHAGIVSGKRAMPGKLLLVRQRLCTRAFLVQDHGLSYPAREARILICDPLKRACARRESRRH